MRYSRSFEHAPQASLAGGRAAAWTPFAENTRHFSEDTNRTSDSDFTPTPRRVSGSREWWPNSRRVSHEGIYPHMLGQPSMSSPLQVDTPPTALSEGGRQTPAAAEPVVGSVWAPTAKQHFAHSNANRAKHTDLTREEELAAAAASSFFAPTPHRPQPPAKSQPPATSQPASDAPMPQPAVSHSSPPHSQLPAAETASPGSTAAAVPQHAQHDRAPTPHGTPSSAFFELQHAQHGRASTPQGKSSLNMLGSQHAQRGTTTMSHGASAFLGPQHAQHERAGIPHARPVSAILESSSSPQLRQQHQHQGAVARRSSPAAPGQQDPSHLGQPPSIAFHGFSDPHRQTQAALLHHRQLRPPMQWQHPILFPPAGAHSQSAGFGAKNPFLRMSADYPQSVSSHRVSADFLRGQAAGVSAQHSTASSLSDLLSRHSHSSEWEPTARHSLPRGQAGRVALSGGNLAPNGMLPGQSYVPGASFGSPAQQQQRLSPQVLQMQALQRLHALRGGVPHQGSGLPGGHMGLSRLSCDYPQSSQLRHTGPAPSALNAAALEFPAWREATRSIQAPLPPLVSSTPNNGAMYSLFGGSSSLDRRPSLGGHASLGGNLSVGGNQPPSRHSSEARAKTSELQGTWGAHLDASPSPPSNSVSRQSSMNPFLQPESAFSIREAKQLLQHPAPEPSRAIPRVDTFASTLHVSVTPNYDVGSLQRESPHESIILSNVGVAMSVNITLPWCYCIDIKTLWPRCRPLGECLDIHLICSMGVGHKQKPRKKEYQNCIGKVSSCW